MSRELTNAEDSMARLLCWTVRQHEGFAESPLVVCPACRAAIVALVDDKPLNPILEYEHGFRDARLRSEPPAIPSEDTREAVIDRAEQACRYAVKHHNFGGSGPAYRQGFEMAAHICETAIRPHVLRHLGDAARAATPTEGKNNG